MILMMLQGSAPPDNVSYLLLGLAVWVVLFGGWLASYVVRWRNLSREQAMLREMAQDEANT